MLHKVHLHHCFEIELSGSKPNAGRIYSNQHSMTVLLSSCFCHLHTRLRNVGSHIRHMRRSSRSRNPYNDGMWNNKKRININYLVSNLLENFEIKLIKWIIFSHFHLEYVGNSYKVFKQNHALLTYIYNWCIIDYINSIVAFLDDLNRLVITTNTARHATTRRVDWLSASEKLTTYFSSLYWFQHLVWSCAVISILILELKCF